MPPSHIFLHDEHRDNFTVTQLLHRGCIFLGLIGYGLWLAVWLRERELLVTFQNSILLRGNRPAYLCCSVCYVRTFEGKSHIAHIFSHILIRMCP